MSCGPALPHHRDGTSRTWIGTSTWSFGSGQFDRHFLPSKSANGTMTPSRRSTPTPNAPDTVVCAAAPTTAAMTPVTRSAARRRGSISAGVYCGGYFLRPLVLRRPPRFLRGTFAPARRASLRPMAIACLRLLTLRPDRPDRSVPRLRSRIARSTFFDAFLPYFAMHSPRRRNLQAACLSGGVMANSRSSARRLALRRSSR